MQNIEHSEQYRLPNLYPDAELHKKRYNIFQVAQNMLLEDNYDDTSLSQQELLEAMNKIAKTKGCSTLDVRHKGGCLWIYYPNLEDNYTKKLRHIGFKYSKNRGGWWVK